MVLLEGIELSTSPLPRECSTTELQQRRARLPSRWGGSVQGMANAKRQLMAERDRNTYVGLAQI